MRNFGIIVVLLAWALLGWKMCTDYEKCCTDQNVPPEAAVAPLPAAPADICSGAVICFADNSCDATYGDQFDRYRDSLSALITPGKKLSITGIYNTDEQYDGSASNLGTCRAAFLRRGFDALSDDQITMAGQLTVGRRSDESERYQIKIIEEALNISTGTGARPSINAQSVIYFPFNSTNKLNDDEIEAYLRKVAVRVKDSGENIRLTGHTDDIGSARSNVTLGQRRANVIADFLMGQGVLRSKIKSESKGEAEPVGNNKTEVGRAKNRRTELQIIS